MRDFSKWEAMWDAYYAQGFSGGAVPGSAASICWNIGLLLTILAGIIIIVCMGSVIDPTTEGTSAVILPGAVFLIGMVLTFASFALPSHTPSRSGRPRCPRKSRRLGIWTIWANAGTAVKNYPNQGLRTATGSASPTPTFNAPN